MRRLLILLLELAGHICLAIQARADGLIFSLPTDGTWAEFTGLRESTCQISLPEGTKLNEEGKAKLDAFSRPTKNQLTIRVSSVGVDSYGGRPCRWIELGRATKSSGSPNSEQSAPPQLLKLLIPDRYLARGEDPLKNANLAFFNSKQADIADVQHEPGFDRIRYEIERFLNCFPPPLKDEKQLKSVTIRTNIGLFKDCEVIQGTSQFDCPLLNGGRWESQFNWTIALHADAPFGVVQLSSDGWVEEINIGNTMKCQVSSEYTLSDKGSNAVTELPEGKRRRIPVLGAP